MKRWIWWSLGLVGLALALQIGAHFPWHETGAALAGASGWLLLAALVLNVVSPLTKAWGWHVLLGAMTPNRWWVAQEANLVGTAVSVVGVGVSGEAARISYIMRRDGVPMRAAVVSVLRSRAVEAFGLLVCIAVVPCAFALPPAVRSLQLIGAVVLLATLIALRLRAGGWSGRLVLPAVLALVNWATQWGTYALVLRAVHIPAPAAASFTALLAVNLGGIVRLTPANAGVTQAAMAAALLPFGIAAQSGVAAGLALQAIQVLPILAIGLAIAGRAGWRRYFVGNGTSELKMSTETSHLPSGCRRRISRNFPWSDIAGRPLAAGIDNEYVPRT